ncbi:MAG: carboxy terminal-processing peptidase [Gammaproteobacteria bacterium]|nr:carboxy terminal-processing peptidase [Gammaproteobacteria bacterium]
MKRILSNALTCLFLLAAFQMAPAEPAASAPLAPDARHRKVSQMVTRFIEEAHYRHANIDDSLSSQIFDQYLEALDPNKVYLLGSDVEKMRRYRQSLDESVKRGQLEPVFEIFNLYRARLLQRTQYAQQLLAEKPDFTVHESFFFDRAESPWAADEAELNEIWRKRVKNDGLSLLLADKTWEEAQETLGKRYQQNVRRVGQVNSDDVFETFMNAYAHTLDPHSTYLAPRSAEEYRISMSLSYEGIGASLEMADEFVSVLNVIAGGPASISGELKPKDRITAVGQGRSGEMVDVVGWRLDDVVELIRGPGGSVVRLQILPSGAAPGSAEHHVDLVRDKVKLEEQAAQRDVIDVERPGSQWRVGVITVPSFYQDYAARAAHKKNYTSTTNDVRRLIAELEAEGIDGLIVDLRGNGGGHLSEAIELSGLFIEDGPLVQLRDYRGATEVLRDPEPEVTYDGPLAVLVDRYSASASEIFAAAMQDYRRGVVVGQQTFGKGSVQNLYTLDNYTRAREGDRGLGQLTLTIGKYYRVTGGSTQHRGVQPDISLPSVIDSETVGESTRETALPWDRIDPIDFTAHTPLNAAVSALTESYQRRAANDPDHNYLLDGISAFEDLREQESVSLNLEVRKDERERTEKERLARENARRAAHGLEPFTSQKELDEAEPVDVALDEAAEIVADMLNLYGPPAVASGAAAAT